MAERKNSEKRIASNNKWTNAHYDRVNLAIPKGRKDAIKALAEIQGQSVNAYINAAIDARMAQEVTGGPVKAPNPYEGAGVVSLPSDTLKAVQEAAETAGETVPQFIDRAVAAQSKQDEAERELKGGNPNE